MEIKTDIEGLYGGVPLEASRDEPEHQVEVLVLGQFEVYLVDPLGDLIEAAQLEWTRDGAPVTQADLGVPTAVLPTTLEDDGRLVASDLPLARYAVKPIATPPDGESAPEYAPVELPWVSRARDLGQPHLQRVRWAERPVYETDSGDPPEEETVLGCLHTALVDRRGQVLSGIPCSWAYNGDPAEGDQLPRRLPDDGVIKVEDVLPGQYELQLEPEESQSEPAEDEDEDPAPKGYHPVRVPWLDEPGETPNYQRVRQR